jgi:hypothetical protein
MNMLTLCDRFHCLPSAVLGEDSELLRMLDIEKLVLDADPDFRTRE